MNHIDFDRLPELESVGSAVCPSSRTDIMPDVVDIIIAVITGSSD